MNNSVGLDNIIKYLESKRDGYLNARQDDNFYGYETNMDIASIISFGIDKIKEARRDMSLINGRGCFLEGNLISVKQCMGCGLQMLIFPNDISKVCEHLWYCK